MDSRPLPRNDPSRDDPRSGGLAAGQKAPQSTAPRRRLPHARAWNVGARTVHLAATGTLLGGHVFGVQPETLLPWLWVTIASGAVMLGVELYTSFDWLTQIGGLAVIFKLALLCVIPFAWPARVPILFAVVAVAGIGSHMPGKYRHYSLLYGRVMKGS